MAILLRRLGMSEVMDWPLDSLIDAAAGALALPIEPEWEPAIKAHLQVNWRLAQEVASFDLPDELEPAPVFET
jgi:1-carboxybiuret hydrolase subunit AtzG-like